MSDRVRRPLPWAPRTQAWPLAAVAGILCAALMGAASAGAATLPTMTITVSSTSVAVGGTIQSGAVNIAALASGKSKEPAAVLVRLKPGGTVAELEAFLQNKKLGRDPNNVGKFGAIVFDVEAGQGKPIEAQTELQPGQYVALNPEGENSSKWPHTAFTVTQASAPATLPAPAATERSIEFGFRGPSTLHDGELVRFENEGFLVHMIIAFPTKGKRAAQKLAKALATGHEKGLEKLVAGPPPGFAGPLSPGGFLQETITAKPGWYVMACFMDTQDGRSHTLLGMERIIKITK